MKEGDDRRDLTAPPFDPLIKAKSHADSQVQAILRRRHAVLNEGHLDDAGEVPPAPQEDRWSEQLRPHRPLPRGGPVQVPGHRLQAQQDGIAKVATIEYDPNRTCFIALLHYADGEKRYILAPIGLEVGQTILSGPDAEPNPGNAKMLRDIPIGVQVHNVEPSGRGQMVRTAGSSAQLTARGGNYAVLLLPSGELRRVHVTCRATIGRVGHRPPERQARQGRAEASPGPPSASAARQ